jgi:hypothetical protein
VTLIGQILSTKLELWYLYGILMEKAHGCVETVAGRVLSTKRELWHLDCEDILTEKKHGCVKRVTEDVSN